MPKNETLRSLRWRIPVAVLLLLIAGVCAFQLIEHQREMARAAEARDKAMEIAMTPAETDPVFVMAGKNGLTDHVNEPPQAVKDLGSINLDALIDANPDVIGWIRIPDTPVDFPVVQGDTNQTYLRKTWDGQSNSAGSIFLDAKNDREPIDRNMIIYGHNMRNGSMFACLHDFKDAEYLDEHGTVYLKLPGQILVYKAFACYEIEKTGFPYMINPPDPNDWLEQCLEHADGTPDVPEGFQTLTLSTCSSSDSQTYRVVLQAILTDTYSY